MMLKKKNQQYKLTSNPWSFLENIVIDGSESGKANALLNLISHPTNNDKIHLYPKDPCEAKYQLLINKPSKV